MGRLNLQNHVKMPSAQQVLVYIGSLFLSLLIVKTAFITFLFNIILYIFNLALILVPTDFLLDYFSNLWYTEFHKCFKKPTDSIHQGMDWGGLFRKVCFSCAIYPKDVLSSTCQKCQQCYPHGLAP